MADPTPRASRDPAGDATALAARSSPGVESAPTADNTDFRADADEHSVADPALDPAHDSAETAPAPDPAPLPPPARPLAVRVRAWLMGESLGATVLGWGLAALGCAAMAAWLLRPGLGVAASAANWLAAQATRGSALDDGIPGVALRGLASRTSWGPALTLPAAQGIGACAVLLAVLVATARARGPVAATLAAVVLVAWPASRDVLVVASAETFLALGTLGIAIAAGLWAATPRGSVVLGALSLALLLCMHPVGAVAALALAVGLALWPGPSAPTEHPGLPEEVGIETRPLWVGWLATVALALAALALATAPGGLKPWFVQTISALRMPAPEPHLGLLAGLPLIGPWTALAGRLPLVLLVFALPAGVRAVRERARAEAPVTGSLVLWLAIAGACGHPLPGLLDLLPVVAPLLVVLGVCGFVDVAGLALGGGTLPARLAVAGLVITAVAAFAADVWLQRGDGRTLVGRIPGVLESVAPLRPVTLRPDEIALLYRHQESTTLHPARPGGPVLGAVLHVLHPALAGVSYGHAQDANLVLLPARPVHTVDRALAASGTRVACTPSAGSCLVRIRGQRPVAAR
ncbi:MAG: hypothetical protein EXR79_03440 [Myxococcales bacterium]|nr:hypothetical protein [Myxococcales bacterium]